MAKSTLPKVNRISVIGDDGRLMAAVSARLGRVGTFLPMVEGPRVGRPDGHSEVTRCINSIVRIQASDFILAGLEEHAIPQVACRLPEDRTTILRHMDELDENRVTGDAKKRNCLVWGPHYIGIGLATALREKKDLVVDSHSDSGSTSTFLEPQSRHLVVCEDDGDLVQTIAANYAHSIGAGLQIFSRIDEEYVEQLLDRFYGVDDPSDQSVSAKLEELRQELRGVVKLEAPIGSLNLITFIVRRLPLGFAYHELPTTHLFAYPHLGRMIINGFACERRSAPGIESAVMIGAGGVAAREFKSVVNALAKRSVYLRGLTDPSIYEASRHIELFPYDILLISTHCGDSSGGRWTYEFEDSEGIPRKFVVDVAIEIQAIPGEEKLLLTQYKRFISLDGVDWSDRAAKEKQYIGTAIVDWLRLTREEGLEPVLKEDTDRVTWSSALKMADGPYLAMPRALAGDRTPIVLNNACGSWHRLASAFTFADARAYIGTLFPVLEVEADAFVTRLFSKHVARPLAVGIWRSQNELYGKMQARRPYVMVGCHFTSLRTRRQNVPLRLISKMTEARDHWQARIDEDTDEDRNRAYVDYVRFLSFEIQHLTEKYVD